MAVQANTTKSMVWSDQYDHKLQIVGLSGSHDRVTIRGDTEDTKFMLFYTQEMS